jgi:hypothetical protein
MSTIVLIVWICFAIVSTFNGVVYLKNKRTNLAVASFITLGVCLFAIAWNYFVSVSPYNYFFG